MKIKDVMTTDVVTVGQNTSLKQVASILAERGISGLPVLDEDGSLLGVVSEADILFKERGPTGRHGILAWLLEPDSAQKLEARTAVQAMTAPARTIGPDRPMSEAAGRMLAEGVNRLPVVDDDGNLLGIVTRADLVRAFVRSDADIEREIREDVRPADALDRARARIAPNKAFGDVLPGKSVSYTFRANDPGVFMYHCDTKPVLMHIANGMYGAIVVEPKPGVLPKADKNYVLVASEWYLDSNGLNKPAQFNMAKAHARQPDWMTFNGYVGQYVQHPLTAKRGELVRFWVVDAGPSLDTDFHIVGTIFNNAYAFGDMNPADVLHNVQTVTVPAGGGGVFDVKIDQPGLYPFVSHAFAAVDQGQVGLLNVGNVK